MTFTEQNTCVDQHKRALEAELERARERREEQVSGLLVGTFQYTGRHRVRTEQ